jgi:hypothetical protein
MATELSLRELEAEIAFELPTREALSTYNWSRIFARNKAVAANQFASNSTATASATQTITVVQTGDIAVLLAGG